MSQEGVAIEDNKTSATFETVVTQPGLSLTEAGGAATEPELSTTIAENDEIGEKQNLNRKVEGHARLLMWAYGQAQRSKLLVVQLLGQRLYLP
jgi:hypothetical protein